MHEPSAIVKGLLVAEDLFSDYDQSWPWPIYLNSLPEIKPDCAVIYDTTPVEDGKSMDGEVSEHYGLQLRVRALASSDGYDKINTAALAMDKIHNEVVTMDDNTQYLVQNVTRATGVVPLGMDEKRRSEFVINWIVSIREK